MGDVANCDMVCDILLGDNVDYHSKARIWNGSDPNHIVSFHGFCDPLAVLLDYTAHFLPKPKCRAGVQV